MHRGRGCVLAGPQFDSLPRPSWPARPPRPRRRRPTSALRTVAPGSRPSPATSGRHRRRASSSCRAAIRAFRPCRAKAVRSSKPPEYLQFQSPRCAELSEAVRTGASRGLGRPGTAGAAGGVPTAVRRRGVAGAHAPAGGKKPPARRPRARGAGCPAGARPRQAEPRPVRRDEAHPPVEAAAPRDHDGRRARRLRALRSDLAGALPSLSGAAPQASAGSDTGGACSGWAPTTPSACSAAISAAL